MLKIALKKYTTIFRAIFVGILFSFSCLSSNCLGYPYSWKNLADFGPIPQFNLFLTGDFVYHNSDVEGRVAVGGNVTLKSFSLGLKAPKTSYTLIAGGNVNLGGPGPADGGQINNGGLWAGGNVNLQRVGLPSGNILAKGNINLQELTIENGGIITEGNVTLQNVAVRKDVIAGGSITIKDSSIHGQQIENSSISITPPLDFSKIDLLALSENLINNNGIVAKPDNGEITIFTDNCTDDVCFINLSSVDFESAWGLSIEGSKKPIIINIFPEDNDTSISINEMSFKIKGDVSSLDILYNFYNFSDIELHHIGLIGSILAPQATVTFYEGVMYGTLIAHNLTCGNHERGGQINIPVPEISSILALLFALPFILKQTKHI